MVFSSNNLLNDNNETLDGALTCECYHACGEMLRLWGEGRWWWGKGGRAVATLKGSTVFPSVGVDIWTGLLIPHSCTVFSQLQRKPCMCVCVRSLRGKGGGGASRPSGSASHGEAVKVPGGGLSGLSGSWSTCLTVGTAGIVEGREGRLYNASANTRIRARGVPNVHTNATCSTCMFTHKSLKVEPCGSGPDLALIPL